MLSILWLIVATAITTGTAFRCGEDGRCKCAADSVMCKGATKFPKFDLTFKEGKKLAITFVKGEVPELTLDEEELLGYRKVEVRGLTAEQCQAIKGDERAKTVVCFARQAVKMMMTGVEEMTTEREMMTTAAMEGEETGDVIADVDVGVTGGGVVLEVQRMQRAMNGLLGWTVMSAFLFAIIVVCLCVSSVSFHSKLNTLLPNPEPPTCIVASCLTVMAVLMIPCQAVAMCFGVQFCCFGDAPPRRPMQV